MHPVPHPLQLACLFMMCVAASSVGQAVEIYRCTAASGAVTYQDKPCAAHQRQHTINLSDVPIVTPLPTPVAVTSTPPPAVPASAPVQAQTHAPLPTMYACTTYDDENKYLSDTLPAPYPVPLGALGYATPSLSQAYGGRDRLGLSAPELARKPTIGRGPLLANAQVLVQDHCVPAPRSQVCDELSQRFKANHAKLRMAFPSEKAPFQQREDELNAQMRGC